LICVKGRRHAGASIKASNDQPENIMLKTKTIVAALAIVGSVGLSGCASTDSAAAAGSSIAERHQHMRDAKQGAPASTAPIVAPKKLLHDHREMK
jgi:hypothetical protein